MSKRILLHVCCGPCAAGCWETLARAGWDEIVLFYSNANIAPRAEYENRLEALRVVADRTGLPLLVDAYEPEAWEAACAGLEQEPEGGARCDRCVQFRLARTAARAAAEGIEAFTTTLTISPHKSSARILAAGAAWSGFQPCNFKKGGGFARAMRLARAWSLYRQRYCGCRFSLMSVARSVPDSPAD